MIVINPRANIFIIKDWFFTTYKVPRDDQQKWKSYSRQILDPTTLENNLL